MIETAKLFGEAATAFWQYPMWIRIVFGLTLVMLFSSLMLAFLFYHPADHKPSKDSVDSGLTISDPVNGNYIIARRISVHGAGARPGVANSLSIKLIDISSGMEIPNHGVLNVNSDGSWRFDYVEFPYSGSFKIVVDAVFGTEQFSKEIIINHRPNEVSEAAATILRNVPEDLDNKPAAAGADREASRQAADVLAATTDIESLDNVSETMYRMGNYFLVERRYDEAIETYKRLLERYPTDAKAISDLSRAFMEKGDIKQAITTMYQFSGRISSRDRSGSLHNLAAVQYTLGRKQEALTILKSIMENDPSYYGAYGLAAEISAELGRTEDAERFYEAAIQASRASLGDAHPQTRKLTDTLRRLHNGQPNKQ